MHTACLSTPLRLTSRAFTPAISLLLESQQRRIALIHHRHPNPVGWLRGLFRLTCYFCAHAFGAELLCSGRSWVEHGIAFNDSVVLKFDSKTLMAALSLSRGTTEGLLVAGEKLYIGNLSFPNGDRVCVDLDRYTGELAVMPVPFEEGDVVILMGKCNEATPKF